MEPQFLDGNETWQELKGRAESKFNEIQRRRKDPENQAMCPIGPIDYLLIGEANFLISLAELERARSWSD